MITRIEIDGFKSFYDFKLDLQPFQVLIGLNGVGKSNLFDAIVLLSHLAQEPSLHKAFEKVRGDIAELFAITGADGERTRKMNFAVEMLIDPQVIDNLGQSTDVTTTRLRYELEIERRREGSFERLYVLREELEGISGDNDAWVKKNGLISKPVQAHYIKRSKGRRGPYISTSSSKDKIWLHQDQRSGQKYEVNIGRIQQTVLSNVTNIEYPTVYAARLEMSNWRFLQLNPEKLRAPSHIFSNSNLLLPDGSNLAAVLERMAKNDEYILSDISIQMANLVPGITKIEVETAVERQEFTIFAESQQGSRFSSKVLSDGTLRLLALEMLRHDPQQHGVLCLEEPENGIVPERLEAVIELLKQLATDFRDFAQGEIPPLLRQILVNTHSPNVLAHVDLTNVVYLYVTAGKNRATRPAYVDKTMLDGVKHKDGLAIFAVDTILQYLNSEPQQEQIKDLQEKRKILQKVNGVS